MEKATSLPPATPSEPVDHLPLRRRWPDYRCAEELRRASATWLAVRPRLIQAGLVDAQEAGPSEEFARHLLWQARMAMKGAATESEEELVDFVRVLAELDDRTRALFGRRRKPAPPRRRNKTSGPALSPKKGCSLAP